MIIKILVIIFSLIIHSAKVHSAELEELRGAGITVQYEAGLERAAKRLVSDYLKAKTDVELKLGWTMQTDPVIILRSHAGFQKIAGNELVTAFAQPGRNLIVINYSKMGRFRSDLNDTLRHELAHILLHHEIGSAPMPKWLDEGVAQWASGGISEIMYTGGRGLLRKAVLSDRLIPLVQLTSKFPDHPDGLILAYEQSKSFIGYIAAKYGDENVRLLLRNFQKNGEIEDAVYETFGISLNSVESAWLDDLSGSISWIAYAADHTTWLLFFLAALITIAGFLAATHRRKNYRDEEDEWEPEKDEEKDTEE